MFINSSINNRNQEVVIQAEPENLRLLANWLLEKANEIETRKHHFSHAHSKGEIDEWKEKWPDIIVYNPRGDR
jgi:hypothetical protein